MKEINITTKNGQKAYLKAYLKSHQLGYDANEKELKIYNEGYIQALKDILGVDYQRFFLDGDIYTNATKKENKANEI